MAGRIITTLSSLLCAAAFFLLSYTGSMNKNPIPLWNGDDSRLKDIIKNVPGYNQKMIRLFRLYAFSFVTAAAAFLFLPIAGIGILLLCCTAGIWILIRKHRQYVKECT